MHSDEPKSRGHGDKRPQKLDRFIQALLSHPSLESAAGAAAVSRSTARRWLADPDVAARIRDARRNAMQRALDALQAAASESVECLCKIQSKGESESVRVTAARCVLDFAIKAVELSDVQARLDAIEQALKTRGRSDARKGFTAA